MIRALLDTNVLASGALGYWLGSTSPPSRILGHWFAQSFGLVISEQILEELDRTLANPYFSERMTRTRTSEILTALRLDSIYVTISSSPPRVASHREDDFILAAADLAEADYIVTGDTMLLRLLVHGRATIVEPGNFAALLDRRESLP